MISSDIDDLIAGPKNFGEITQIEGLDTIKYVVQYLI